MVDWLDPHVIIAHHNTSSPGTYPVLLWDTRIDSDIQIGAQATTSRFLVNERTTGLQYSNNLDWPINKHLITVSTNHSIRLYDIRMPHMESRPDRPLMSFKHVHEGPKLHFADNGRGLIAAADRDNNVQIYSTRTGKNIAIGSPGGWRESRSKGPRIPAPRGLDFEKGLQWYDDYHGGTSLLCFTNRQAFRWLWQPNWSA
jgi:WD40 repeat protein